MLFKYFVFRKGGKGLVSLTCWRKKGEKELSAEGHKKVSLLFLE